jgi:hypothetical protein
LIVPIAKSSRSAARRNLVLEVLQFGADDQCVLVLVTDAWRPEKQMRRGVKNKYPKWQVMIYTRKIAEILMHA